MMTENMMGTNDDRKYDDRKYDDKKMIENMMIVNIMIENMIEHIMKYDEITNMLRYPIFRHKKCGGKRTPLVDTSENPKNEQTGRSC